MAERASGGPPLPYVDPTANVIALVAAHEKKIAELMLAAEKLVDEKIAGTRRALEQVEKNFERSLERESQRVDKNRMLDRDAVDRAALRLAEEVKELAKNKQASDDGLRTQIATSSAQLSDRVGKLELAGGTGAGKGVGMRELWALIVGAILLGLAIWSKFGT